MKLLTSIARCAILLAAGACSTPAKAWVVYDIDIQNLKLGQTYNSKNEAEFHAPDNPNLQGQASGDHLKVVPHPTLEGKKALEFMVQKSIAPVPVHKGRSEVASPYNLGGTADYYLGFRIFFPDDFPKDAREFLFIQGGNSSNHPIVSASIKNDLISFPGYDMPLERNRWYKMEYRIKMGTTAATGKFQLWVDNVQRSDVSMKTADAESSPRNKEYIYKLGMYAYNWRYAPKEGPDRYRYLVDHLALASTRAEAEAKAAK